jgi:hypothetical protein
VSPAAETWWTTTKVRRIALLVGVLQTAFVAVSVISSGYFADDYLFFVIDRVGGFSIHTLTGSVYGSLIPGFQLGNSILASFHPVPRWPGVVFPVVLYALVLFVFYRLLELLFGTRPLLIVLVSLAGLSSVLCTSLVWWTAALNSLPAVLLDLLAVDGLARHAATGQRRHLAVTVVAFAVGVAFYDGSGSFVVPLVVFTALFLVDRSDRRTFWQGMISRAWVWVGLALPVAFSLAWRSAHPQQFALPPLPTVGNAIHFVINGWGAGFVPELFGLPLSNVTNPALRMLIIVFGQGLIVGAIALTVSRRRMAWRAWAFFASSFAAIELVVVIGRGGYLLTSSINPVYWTVQPFMLALALGLALLPSPVEWCAPAPVTTKKAPPRLPRTMPQPRWAGWSAPPGIVVAAVVVFAVVGMRASWTSPAREQGAENHAYTQNMAASWARIKQTDAHAFVWNTEGPKFLIPFLLGYNRVATTTGSLVDLKIDATSGQGYVADANGTLVPATPDVVSRAELGSSGGGATGGACVSAGSPDRLLRVRLSAVVPAGSWFLRLAFTHSSGFTISLNRNPVALTRGSGTLLEPDEASIESSQLSLRVPLRASLCISHADFEAPVAKGTKKPVTGAPVGPSVPGGPVT